MFETEVTLLGARAGEPVQVEVEFTVSGDSRRATMYSPAEGPELEVHAITVVSDSGGLLSEGALLGAEEIHEDVRALVWEWLED